MQAITAHPTLLSPFEGIDINLDWVIEDWDKASDLAEDVANRLIDAIMRLLAHLPFGDQVVEFLSSLCMRVCNWIDSTEAYLKYLDENFDTVGAHEIAAKLTAVVKAIVRVAMIYAEQEMFLLSSAEAAIAAFVDRIGGHASGKIQ